MIDPAGQLQAQLRADLKLAMLGRRPEEVSVLRSLIAALDNAQAVPVGDLHDRYTVHVFGDNSVEQPRLKLGPDDLHTVLNGEIEARRAASAEYRDAGLHDHAERWSRESEIVGRYLS
jgi:uncharacterized protein YqeY